MMADDAVDLSALDNLKSPESPISDLELAALAHTESNDNPKAVSPAGAKGLFQFTDSTAKDYGLDDPFDPAASKVAARKYLEKLHAKYNDKGLTFAAYNWGPGNVDKLLSKKQGAGFGDIYPLLPKETQQHGDRIRSYLAANNPSSAALQVPTDQSVGGEPNVDLGALTDGVDLSSLDHAEGPPQTWAEVGQRAMDQSVNSPLSKLDNSSPSNYLASRGKSLAGLTYGAVEGVPVAVIGAGEHIINAASQLIQKAMGRKMTDQEMADAIKQAPVSEMLDKKLNEMFMTDPSLKDDPSFQAGQELAGAPINYPLQLIKGAIGKVTGSQAAAEAVGSVAEGLAVLLPLKHALSRAKAKALIEKPDGTAAADLAKPTMAPDPMGDIGIPMESPESPIADVLKTQKNDSTRAVRTQYDQMPGLDDRLDANLAKPEFGVRDPLSTTDLGEPKVEGSARPSSSLKTEPVQQSIDFTRGVVDDATDKYTSSLNKPGFTRTAEDLLRLKDERVPEAIRNPSEVAMDALRKKQGGAVDISDLEGPARTIQSVMSMSLLRKLKGMFDEQKTPNEQSLAFLREKMKDGKLPNEQDKPIVVITDKGAAIYDGNHRVKVADELGWKDVPVTVKDYSTGNDLPSGKPIVEGRRAVLGGVGKKQGGAIDIKALFGRDVSKGTPAPTQQDLVMDKSGRDDIIIRGLEESATYDDFVSHLKLQSRDPTYVRDVVDMAGQLWASRRNLLDGYSGSAYSRLNDALKKQTADVGRTLSRAIEEEGWNKAFSDKNDVSLASVRTLDAFTFEQLNFDKLGGRFAKWVIDNTREKINLGQKLYREMADHMKDYGNLDRKEQASLTQVMIDLDGTQGSTLKGLGLQWATPDMLKQLGMNPAQIKAYDGITKALDRSYDLISQAFAKVGKIPPDKIPGYFPHFWMGSYKVLLRDPSGKLVAMKAFSTKYGAEWYAKKAPTQGLDPEIQLPKADVYNKEYSTLMIQALELQGNLKGIDKAMQSRLIAMDAYAKRGIIKDVLEREWIDGHVASEGIRPDHIWNRAHNDRLVSAYNAHIEAVSNFATNTSIVSDVYGPAIVHFDLLENTPNAKEYIQRFVSNATGHKVNKAADFDIMLRDAAIHIGVPPQSFHGIVQGLGSLLAITKLVIPNGRFILSQLFQPITQMGQIELAHAQITAAGIKGGNPFKAAARMVAEQANLTAGRPSELIQALQWAVDNHHIQVYQADHLSPWKQHDNAYQAVDAVTRNPLEEIEKGGRSSSFVAMYSYFRDVYPTKREALEAAATRMNMVMGNYERTNTARMYSDYGIAGQALKPFAILRNIYLGVAADSLKFAAKEFKNNPVRAIAPFAALQGTYLVAAGITGMLGFQEYDLLAKTYNELMDPDKPLPRSAELLRKYGVNDFGIYGAISQLLPGKPNVGPSMGAPAANEAAGIPALSAGKAVGGLAIEAGKGIGQAMGLGSSPNYENVYKHARTLAPTMAVPWIEDYVASKQGGVQPNSTNFNGGVTRTPQEDLTAKVYGARSTTEEDKRTVNQLSKYGDKQDADWKNQQVSKIVDSMLGLGLSKPGDEIKKAMEADRGFSNTTLLKSIKEEIKRRITDEQTRRLSEISKSTNPAKKSYDLRQLIQLDRKFQ